MKTLPALSFAVALFGIALVAPARSEVADAPATCQPGDLQRLNQEYERRRAEALRPVTAWYRAQLEALAKSLEKEGQAVAEARGKAAESSWQDDQPELRRALLRPGWIWRSEEDGDGVSLKFLEDGSAHHSGLNGTWRITGPNEVTVQPDNDGKYILRFDASLRTFLGDRRGVEGERRDGER